MSTEPSPFDVWIEQFPGGWAPESSQRELARKLVTEGTWSESDIPPDLSVDENEGVLVDQEEKKKFLSENGIPVRWFLHRFVKSPEIKALIEFGCPLWFVRNICVPELLRYKGIHSGPLVEHLHLFDEGSAPPAQKATRFISYTGSYSFQRLVEMIAQIGEDECIWIDIFCVDQIAWKNGKEKKLRDNFVDDISPMILNIGTTVLFLDRFDQPMTAMGKIWVLWEVYCTLQAAAAATESSVTLQLVLHPEEHDRFWDNGLRRDMDTIMNSICSIDVDNATASNEKVREIIFRRMQNDRGVHHVNRKICEHLRDWFISAGYTHLEESVTIRNEMNLTLCNNFGVLLARFGRFTEADHLYHITQRALEKIASSDDDDNAMTEDMIHMKAVSWHNRALCLMDRGQNDEEAEALLRGSIELQSTNLRKRLTSKNGLSRLLCRLKRFDEAGELQQEVVLKGIEHYGWSDPDVIEWICGLADVLDYQGAIQLAETLFERCFDEISSQQGSRSTQAINCLAGLASTMSGRGNLAGSEKVLVRTLRMLTEVYGGDHCGTLLVAARLARLCEEMGRRFRVGPLYAAIEAQVEASSTDASVSARDNCDLLRALQQRARSLAEKHSDYEQAERIIRLVLKHQQDILPPNHVDILESMYVLGHGILTMRPDRTEDSLKEGERLIAQLIQIGENTFGPNDERVLEWLNAHTDILLWLDRAKDAETVFRATLNVVSVVFGEVSIPKFSTLAGLSAALQQQQRLTDAVVYAEKALELGIEVVGPYHPMVEKVAKRLETMRIQQQNEQYEASKKKEEEAVASEALDEALDEETFGAGKKITEALLDGGKRKAIGSPEKTMKKPEKTVNEDESDEVARPKLCGHCHRRPCFMLDGESGACLTMVGDDLIDEGKTNAQVRRTLYRDAALMLGRDVRKELPLCVVVDIRNAFPKSADEECEEA